MKKYISLLFIIAFLISCKIQKPFANNREQNANIKIIRKKTSISRAELNLLKKQDSAVYEVGLSLKEKVKPKLVRRRLDSFFNGNYSRKELLMIIKIDRAFNGEETTFEFDRESDPNDLINLKSIEETKEFMKTIDETFSKSIKITVNDSIKKIN